MSGRFAIYEVSGMKMTAEYLEHALQFERMASEERCPKAKKQLQDQAAAYRKLAQERAKKINLPLPPRRPPQSK
jgi:hypothetical protein